MSKQTNCENCNGINAQQNTNNGLLSS
jgi:hypothetical protein